MLATHAPIYLSYGGGRVARGSRIKYTGVVYEPGTLDDSVIHDIASLTISRSFVRFAIGASEMRALYTRWSAGACSLAGNLYANDEHRVNTV